MNDPTCPKCGNQFEAGTEACKFDGTPLVAASDLVVTCPQCGRKFSGGTNFCPEDGAEIFPERARTEKLPQSGALPSSPAALAQENFSLLPDEKIIMETRNAYYYEHSLFFKAGSIYLTQLRFVFCNNHSFLWPILFASVGGAYTSISGYGSALGFFLGYLVAYAFLLARKPTKITFQIPVPQIKSILKKRYGLGYKYTFLTDTEAQYVIQFLYKRQRWESALGSLGLDIQSLAKGETPVARGPEPAAAIATSGPTGNDTAAPSPVGLEAKDLAGKSDWLPVLTLIVVIVMAIGAGAYFWMAYQAAPPTAPEVKAPPGIKEKAAQGDAKAQYYLGLMYFEGKGVKQDLTQARLWFEKAAAQGNPQAQDNLGFMYANGRGVTQDFSQAKAWFEKAAAQGDPRGQFNLGFMYAKGDGVKPDLAQARLWYEKAAAQGHSKAQVNLGFMYSQGRGVEQDLAKAKELYEKAAAQGNAVAQNNLGFMYANGRGVEQDLAQARSWYEKAAARGHRNAQFHLGDMYYHGQGGEQDLAKAKLWYEKAAARGHAKAKEALEKLKSN